MPKTVSTADLDQLLDTCVRTLAGQERAGQRELMHRTFTNLSRGQQLIAQAGTGTGKTLAYLIAAMAYEVQSGEKVLIATATIALQHQILNHDFPIAAAAFEKHKFAVPELRLLKGRNNYLCLNKLSGSYPVSDTLWEAAQQPSDGLVPDSAAESGAGNPGLSALGRQIQTIRSWAEETSTGDRDELPPGITDQAWRHLSVSSSACIGAKCKFVTECYSELARAEARTAGIVVVNHTLLGLASLSENEILPDAKALIIDEAHELVSRVTSAATRLLSVGSLRACARALSPVASHKPELTRLADTFAEFITAEESYFIQPMTSELLAHLQSTHTVLRKILHDFEDSQGMDDSQVLAKRQATELYEVVTDILEVTRAPVEQRRQVVWSIHGENKDPALAIAPLQVNTLLANQVYEDKAVLATSATLDLGGSLRGMSQQLGLFDADEQYVASPFSYERQSILYLETQLPAPSAGGYDDAGVSERMAQLITASGGGGLGLFSSLAAAQRIGELVRDRVETPVLIQGEDQLASLIREFKAGRDVNLFGTLSLWQGLDVPGSPCRLVMVDRIPFPRPNDPLIAARSRAAERAGTSGFSAVSMPHAGVLLAQGVGRLIRSTSDRGVVAILDSRVAKAGYGKYLIKSLPPMWRTTDFGVAVQSLERLSAELADSADALEGAEG